MRCWWIRWSVICEHIVVVARCVRKMTRSPQDDGVLLNLDKGIMFVRAVDDGGIMPRASSPTAPPAIQGKRISYASARW